METLLYYDIIGSPKTAIDVNYFLDIELSIKTGPGTRSHHKWRQSYGNVTLTCVFFHYAETDVLRLPVTVGELSDLDSMTEQMFYSTELGPMSPARETGNWKSRFEKDRFVISYDHNEKIYETALDPHAVERLVIGLKAKRYLEEMYRMRYDLDSIENQSRIFIVTCAEYVMKLAVENYVKGEETSYFVACKRLVSQPEFRSIFKTDVTKLYNKVKERLGLTMNLENRTLEMFLAVFPRVSNKFNDRRVTWNGEKLVVRGIANLSE